MKKQKNILVTLDDKNGNPHLEGTGLIVSYIVLGCIDIGVPNYLDDFPDVTIDDLHLVVEYCQSLQCEIDGSHCGGCSLRDIQDEIFSKDDYIKRFSEIRFLNSEEILYGGGKEGVMCLPGTLEDLNYFWKGRDIWLLAKKLKKQLKFPEKMDSISKRPKRKNRKKYFIN